MASADDPVWDPLPNAQAPRDIWPHTALVENTTIYPDALRRFLQAEREHPPTLETSSSAVHITPEDLDSAIIHVNTSGRVGISMSVFRGLLEVPGRRPVPVAIWADGSESYEQLPLAREMKIWPTLDHPRILPLLGHGTFGLMMIALVTPSCSANLRSYLQMNQKLDKRRLIIQVAEGLEYLHEQRSIVHGNLIMSSVLINADGDAVLSGFKLSTWAVKPPLADPTATAIRARHTVQSAAPEVLVDECRDASGKRSKTTESDIYAFGMLIYEILSGRQPWPGSKALQVMVNVINGQRPTRPEETQMNDSMWELCVACWDQEPAKRPRIADILAGLRSHEPPSFWQVITDPADSGIPSDLHGPDLQVPESTLRVVLHDTDVDIVLPAQTPIRGGFGVVFKGHAMICGVETILAVKHCPAYKIQPREYSIWKSLSHKNILPLYGGVELGVAPPRQSIDFVFLSPYMTRGNLVGYLKLNPGVDRLPLMKDVAAGLDYLHNTAKIVHGDIKAENVLISDDGRAVLSDFGLSTTVASGPQLSGSQVRHMYTLAYAAPEIIDDTAVDTAAPGVLRSKTKMSDMYAYGVLLYQVYAGGFGRDKGERIRLIAAMHEGRWPKRPIGRLPVLCDDLWSICTRCWDREPKDRPSVARVLGELRYLESSPERLKIQTPEPDAPQDVWTDARVAENHM